MHMGDVGGPSATSNAHVYLCIMCIGGSCQLWVGFLLPPICAEDSIDIMHWRWHRKDMAQGYTMCDAFWDCGMGCDVIRRVQGKS